MEATGQSEKEAKKKAIQKSKRIGQISIIWKKNFYWN